MSSLLQWKDSHLCNPRLCALIQVIYRLADKNAALRIQYHSSSSQINFTFLYVYKCVVDQNVYNKVSDTFINYKKKLKLSFLVLGSNDAIIQLSWGTEGDG